VTAFDRNADKANALIESGRGTRGALYRRVWRSGADVVLSSLTDDEVVHKRIHRAARGARNIFAVVR